MLEIHDDIIIATNEFIKQTHVRHEKSIQILEMEILQKDDMTIVM